MDDRALTSPGMVCPALETANRRLIEAIEAPPETGVEGRLDRVAAVTWFYANESTSRPGPGRLRQLAVLLESVESETTGRKRLLVRDARGAIRRASAGLEAV